MIRFARVKDVKMPNRGTSRSAGIDFYTPNNMVNTLLLPGEDALIPSGIKAEIPEGYALIAFNKSGVSTKQRLAIGAEVVDEDYQGEIHLHVYNSGTKNETITAGQKLVQMVLIPVSYAEIVEVKEGDLFIEKTQRGEGGFGSTGLK